MSQAYSRDSGKLLSAPAWETRAASPSGECLVTMNTALALRQGIWHKPDSWWEMCGLFEVFYVDHGSDFTSGHSYRVAIDLHLRVNKCLRGCSSGWQCWSGAGAPFDRGTRFPHHSSLHRGSSENYPQGAGARVGPSHRVAVSGGTERSFRQRQLALTLLDFTDVVRGLDRHSGGMSIRGRKPVRAPDVRRRPLRRVPASAGLIGSSPGCRCGDSVASEFRSLHDLHNDRVSKGCRATGCIGWLPDYEDRDDTWSGPSHRRWRTWGNKTTSVVVGAVASG